MLRRLLRRNMRALADGARVEPYTIGRDGLVATFCQDTILPAPTAEDRALLAKQGKAVADAVLASAGEPAAGRRAAIEALLARAGD
jgi:hypothetical protein